MICVIVNSITCQWVVRVLHKPQVRGIFSPVTGEKIILTYAPAVDRIQAAGSEIRHYHITVKAASYSKAVHMLLNYSRPHCTYNYDSHFYAPNFGKVEFRLVSVSIRVSVQNLLRYSWACSKIMKPKSDIGGEK